MADLRVLESHNTLLDMDAAAHFLNIKKSTLYQMVMRKEIPHIKIGRLTRFTPDQIVDYLEANTIGEPNNGAGL